jgi:hypothetical protein
LSSNYQPLADWEGAASQLVQPNQDFVCLMISAYSRAQLKQNPRSRMLGAWDSKECWKRIRRSHGSALEWQARQSRPLWTPISNWTSESRGERRRAPRAQDRNRRVTEAVNHGLAASKTAITSDLR